MRKQIVLSVGVAVAMGCFGLARSRATAITVPNYDSDSPQGPYPDQVSLTITDWTTTGPPSEVVNIGDGPQNSGVGIFQNSYPGSPGYATNAPNPPAGETANLVYMFAGSEDPTSDLHTLSQVLGTSFAANTRYTLTVGVQDASAPPSPGAQVSIQLFYTTAADPNTPVYLATTNVVQGTSSLSDTSLTDYSATAALGADDAAVGNDIGVIVTTSAPTGAGVGEFDLDNVRLDASPVPEPSAVAIMGLAMAGGLLRRRRCPGRIAV